MEIILFSNVRKSLFALSITFLLFGCNKQSSIIQTEHDIEVSVFESGTGNPVIGEIFHLIPTEGLNNLSSVMGKVFLETAESHKKKYCKQIIKKYSPQKPWWKNYNDEEYRDYLVLREDIIKLDCDDIALTDSTAKAYINVIKKLSYIWANDYRKAFFNKLDKPYYEYLKMASKYTMSTGIDGKISLSAPTDEYFFIVVSRGDSYNRYIKNTKLFSVRRAVQVNLSSYDHDTNWEKYSLNNQLDFWLKEPQIGDY